MERHFVFAALGSLASVVAMSCVDPSRVATCPTGAGDMGSAPAVLKACAAGTRPAEDGTIDDFEDGDNQLTKIAGRDGYWFTSHDDKGSTIGPNPLKMAEGGAGGSSKALHILGQTADGNGAWGSLLGANFMAQGLYDASGYAGISFQAKVGPSSTRKVRFKVGDVNTHPDGGVCKECWNHFGKDLVLTTDWQEYKITFAEMKQEAGWGERYGAVTPSRLVSMNWSFGPGAAFDLWIDDLQFFDCL
jgi:hypothetical protein